MITTTPMAHERVDISVVMPCLNEAETIGTCVAWALEGIEKSGRPGEVIVSDNGSTDGSVEIAERAGARVVHQPLRGYGNAYRKGFAESYGDVIIMGDSDATYDFREIPALLAPMANGAEYVLGSRFGGTILPGAMPWLHRYIGNPILTRVLNVFFGYSSSDAHSGMRAFTRSGYERMDLRCEGMEFASEIVIKAARAGLKVAEVPIVYYPRGGESKLRSFRDGWRHLRFMLLACPKYLFILPGVVLWVLGLLGQTVALPGTVALAGHVLDVHISALFALLTALGFQLMTFAGFAKVHARASGFDRTDGFDRWLRNDFTLERGLMAGLLILLFGLVINLYILVDWIAGSFGPLNQIRPALFAMSLMMTGAQTMFAAFFLSLAADVSKSLGTPRLARELATVG